MPPVNATRALAPVLLCLACYAAGLLLWFPSTLSVDDEGAYIRQAVLFSTGDIKSNVFDPVAGETAAIYVSNYPVGTSALMAPFIKLFGWKSGFIIPGLALLLATFVLAIWLLEAGRSPLFSLLFLGFIPSLAMGRLAMSDTPAAAITLTSLWLFWHGKTRHWRWWLGSGCLAGGALLFRESAPLLIAPFFAGAVLRRNPKALALFCGGLLGLSLRLVTGEIVYNNMLFRKDPGYHFALSSVAAHIPLYLLLTMVAVPAGLVLGVLYRGENRHELVTAISLFMLLYLSYGYAGEPSGMLKSVILGGRFFMPLAGLLAFAMAESVPRLWQNLVISSPGERQRRLAMVPRLARLILVVGVAGAAFAVHPVFARLGANYGAVTATTYEITPEHSVLVTNIAATHKLINDLHGERTVVADIHLKPADTTKILNSKGALYLVFLSRNDSDGWRRDAKRTQRLVAWMSDRFHVKLLRDQEYQRVGRLRIWSVKP